MLKKKLLVAMAIGMAMATPCVASQVPGDYMLTGEPINESEMGIYNFETGYLFGRKVAEIARSANQDTRAEYVWETLDGVQWTGETATSRTENSAVMQGSFNSDSASAYVSLNADKTGETWAIRGDINYIQDDETKLSGTFNGGGILADYGPSGRIFVLCRNEESGIEIAIEYAMAGNSVTGTYTVQQNGSLLGQHIFSYEAMEPLVVADVDYIFRQI